jgi:hypothetical protein
MSYQYQSYSETTTTTRNASGQTHTRTTRTTTTSDSESGTVVIREISENELATLSLENTQNYEITDEDRLTKYDFYSLMNTEDEATESESESDVEYHWFPSLLHTSFIEFLDDSEQEKYMEEDDTNDAIVQENEEEEDEEEEDVKLHGRNGKRYHHRHSKKHSKRPRKSEEVPVDVIHIIL